MPYTDRTGPEIVCKQKDEAKIEALPPLPQPMFKFAYTVRSGDNLSRIAEGELGKNKREAYLKALDIAETHGIKPPYIIRPGDVLILRNK